MIVRSRGASREVRMAEWGTSFIPPWSQFSGGDAGVPVNLKSAGGIPAFLASIRLISETIGAMPCRIYRGRDGERKAALDSWQWQLLAERPNAEQSPVNFFQDAVASLDSTGNFYAQKIKGGRGGKVLALRPLNSETVRVERDRDGAKVFKIRIEGADRSFGSDEILHIRGFTFAGGLEGVSPLKAAALKLGTAIAQERFHASYYRNNAQPGLVLTFPQDMTREKAKPWIDEWDAKHQGVENVGKTNVLGGGASVTPISISLEDAQFIEGQKMSAMEVARIFLGPAVSLLYGDRTKTEEESLRFFNFTLLPRIALVESALKADPDLFAGSSEYPEFDTSEFLRADAATRATVRHLQIQDGTLLVDEARAEDGRPPLPPLPDDPSKTPGMVPQITPVGGAVNPTAVAANANGAANAQEVMRALGFNPTEE